MPAIALEKLRWPAIPFCLWLRIFWDAMRLS
jgi:hypothetical protein